MARRFFFSVLLLLPSVGFATFEQCLDHFPEHQPPSLLLEDARDLCFESFALLYSPRTKAPIFSVERLNRRRLSEARSNHRGSHFYEEARLPKLERATLNDFQGAGYDRGHVAPAGDMPNDNAVAQSFSLANVVPQDPEHNRHVWKRIEQNVRQYVLRARGDVFVFTGPYFGASYTSIGAGVGVPDALWKVVFDRDTGTAWVHWSKNSGDGRVEAPITYDEFVKRTGLTLLPHQY